MKTTIDIKNFRVFNANGVTFELNPITILTGSNSSGKSSLVKALFLLNSFLAQIKKDIENGEQIELDKYKLDFTTYPNNLLGRFDKVLHDGSETKSITIDYTTYSLMLSKEVIVQLVFSADENDELNNAYLETITMSTDEGIFFHAGKGDLSYCNLNIIKEDYITFLLTEFSEHNYCSALCAWDIEDKISKEEFDETKKQVVDYLRTVDKARKADIYKYVRICKRQESLIHTLNADPSVIEDLQGKLSIFAIPVIDKISTLPKSEVKDFITSEFLENAAKDTIFATHKAIDAFLTSEFETFSDFFADFEKRSFSKRYYCSERWFSEIKKTFRLMQANDLTIRQDYLTFDPYHREMGIWISLDDFKPIEKDEVTEKAEKQAMIEAWEERDLTFDMLYEVVMEWNKKFAYDGKGVYSYAEPHRFAPWGHYDHIAYKLLTKFVEELLQEVICPDWCGNMFYVSSARSSVRRLYSLENSDDFSLLLRKYFEQKRVYLDKQKNVYSGPQRDYVVDSFMNRWIEKFEIGKAISLHIDQEGLGVQIRLHKSEDDTGRILADEGYGITQLVSILLQIETAILAAKGLKVNSFYGQSAFDNFDDSAFHYEINTIAIEEPEIHLHPKFQSLLADMFLEAYGKYNIHFIIETHSEYLIRKTQLLAAKIVPIESNPEELIYYEKGVDSISIYYIDSGKSAKRINICSDGYLDDSFGEGFFDEATRLSRRLISD